MKKLLLALMCAGTLYGQGVRVDSYVWTAATNVPFGAKAPMMTLPNSTITVCAYPGDNSPCDNLITIYSDQALTVPAPNPITADALGRYGFFVAPGTYVYSVTDSRGNDGGTYTFAAPFSTLNGDLPITGKIIAPSAILGSITTVQGVPSNQSTTTTTGTGTGTALTLASAGDFVAGQGLLVSHGGQACGSVRGTACPTGPTPSVTPSGAAGTTTYGYKVACIDGLGGVGIAGPVGTVTTGNASLSTANSNVLTMTSQPGCIEVAVYRGAYLIGTQYSPPTGTFTFTDTGLAAVTSSRDVPLAPPSAALAENYVGMLTGYTTGTVATVSPALGAAVTAATVFHSDTPILQAAINQGGAVQGNTVYHINYPLSLTGKSGTYSFYAFCDTGDICVDATGQKGVTLNNVSLDAYAAPTPSTIGLYCSRDAATPYSQYLTTVKMYANIGGGLNSTGHGSVAYYDYGCEIQSHTSGNLNADNLNVLTSLNLWNVPSLFDGTQLTGPQSMSQIVFVQPSGGTLGAFWVFDNAFTVSIVGGYNFGGFSVTQPYGVEVYGQLGDFKVFGYRTEGKAGFAHMNAGSKLIYSTLDASVFRNNTTLPVMRLEDGAVIEQTRLRLDDFGGSATVEPIYTCTTISCAVNYSDISVGVNQTFDTTHGSSNLVRKVNGPLAYSGAIQYTNPVNINGQDLNTLTGCGQMAGNNLVNGPTAFGTNSMLVTNFCSGDPLYGAQEVRDGQFATFHTYSRQKSLGTWTPWHLSSVE